MGFFTNLSDTIKQQSFSDASLDAQPNGWIATREVYTNRCAYNVLDKFTGAEG